MAPTPLLDAIRRGDVEREVRLLAARAVAAPRAHEQMAILVLLVRDNDSEIATAAQATIDQIPAARLRGYLALSDIPADVRTFLTARTLEAADAAPVSADEPLIQDASDAGVIDVLAEPSEAPSDLPPETLLQKLQKMAFTDRIKAAMRGTREMRAVLIRDPNKIIATAVLSSPKVSEAEVEGFARMGTVSEDVLRTISMNRAWVKNYGVVLALTRNSKTPLAISLNLLNRLTERDTNAISTDRNVPDALRIAARRKIALSSNR